MFYKGVLRSYDQNSEKGNLYFAELDLILPFSLEDFPNPNQSPQVGERVKCLIKDVEEIKQAKCIIRLDFKNSADPEPQNTSHLKVRQQNTNLNQKSDPSVSINESSENIELEQQQLNNKENSGTQDSFIENEKKIETAKLDHVEDSFNLNQAQIDNESVSDFFTFKDIDPQFDQIDESSEHLKIHQFNDGHDENHTEREFVLSNTGDVKSDLKHNVKQMESFTFTVDEDLFQNHEVSTPIINQSAVQEVESFQSTLISSENELSITQDQMIHLNENDIPDHINQSRTDLSNNEILEFVLDQTNSDQTNSDEISVQDEKNSIDLELAENLILDKVIAQPQTGALSENASNSNEDIKLADSELNNLNPEIVQAEKQHKEDLINFEPIISLESVSSESNLIEEDDTQNKNSKYQVNEIDKPKVATIEEIKQILEKQGTKNFEDNSEANDVNNQNHYIENSKETERTQKDSFFKKIKTKFGYKSYKPKKEKKKKEVYFNPWIILFMILIPTLGYWGEKGYQKYVIYKQEQEAKAQQYMLDQEKIIEEQRKKLGKLPDKILSDETLDELLGKDRKNAQPKEEKK